MTTTLSEMRDGLHVSVSQVKCYLRCPRQYQLRYVLGAEAEFMPANLVLGSAVHEGLAAFYRSVMTTSESPEFDVCMAAFHATLVGFRKGKLPIKDGDKIEAQGEALLKIFYETTYQDPPNVVGGGPCAVTNTCLTTDCNGGCSICDNMAGPGSQGCYLQGGLNGPCSVYWSSSIYFDSDRASYRYRYIDFSDGNLWSCDPSDGNYVRCVRRSQ